MNAAPTAAAVWAERMCEVASGAAINARACFSPPSVGGLDLNSSNSGCARLGSGVAPPLGVVKEEVTTLIVLLRRYRRDVGAAVRRAVDDEVPGTVEEEAGPAAVRRVPPGLLDALPVHELVFVALEFQICAALAKAQPAQPSLRISCVFPNAGGALEDT